jgi:hypothetical protein
MTDDESKWRMKLLGNAGSECINAALVHLRGELRELKNQIKDLDCYGGSMIEPDAISRIRADQLERIKCIEADIEVLGPLYEAVQAQEADRKVLEPLYKAVQAEETRRKLRLKARMDERRARWKLRFIRAIRGPRPPES